MISVLKSVQNLVNDARHNITASCYGNHSFNKKGGLWYFRYHGSPVCIVDPNDRTVSINFCGYDGAPSTVRTVNSYLEAFSTYQKVDRAIHEGRK